MQIQQSIETTIKAAFKPDYFELLNESQQHNVPENSETHFKLTLVSDDFATDSKVKRHQKVYQLLGPLMQQGLHALALHLYTKDEWDKTHAQSPQSPPCLGGSGR